MFPSYIVFITIGVLLALVSSRLPNQPAWNKAAMLGLAIAIALVLYGFGIFVDS